MNHGKVSKEIARRPAALKRRIAARNPVLEN